MSAGPDDVVVRAGVPVLAVGLHAHDHGARVRVAERDPVALRPSRALIVHPRCRPGAEREDRSSPARTRVALLALRLCEPGWWRGPEPVRDGPHLLAAARSGGPSPREATCTTERSTS
ncbi:hypothetical protein C6N75_02365 [Streptomyces solincola]|uniref:Uncharacterized protein n=1 Tax=Streptomyces solincola TaxID=2100817 RepID=A0A2S9Q2B0_9ACTN|nr:hypothetical protein C6N75_02365 [Streptomyces solincola]